MPTTEARVWWGWHDGVTASTRPEGESFPGWWFPSLHDAATQAEWERNEASALVGRDAENLIWRSGWLPILTDIGGNHAVLDCTAPPDGPSPVYYADREGGPEKFRPRAPTFGALIAGWIEAIDRGAAHYDGTRWHRDYGRLNTDPALRARLAPLRRTAYAHRSSSGPGVRQRGVSVHTSSRMVRKGSPVRVRQRALTKALLLAAVAGRRDGTSAVGRIVKVPRRYSGGRCRRSSRRHEAAPERESATAQPTSLP